MQSAGFRVVCSNKEILFTQLKYTKTHSAFFPFITKNRPFFSGLLVLPAPCPITQSSRNSLISFGFKRLIPEKSGLSSSSFPSSSSRISLQSSIHSSQLYSPREDPRYTHFLGDSATVYLQIVSGCLDRQYYTQVHTPRSKAHPLPHLIHPETNTICIQSDKTKISPPSSITTRTSDKYRTAVENEHRVSDLQIPQHQ